jgi:hypothetical protein
MEVLEKEVIISEIEEVTKHFEVIPVLTYLKSIGKHSEYVRGNLYLVGDKKLDFISNMIESIHKDKRVEFEKLQDKIKIKIYSK